MHWIWNIQAMLICNLKVSHLSVVCVCVCVIFSLAFFGRACKSYGWISLNFNFTTVTDDFYFIFSLFYYSVIPSSNNHLSVWLHMFLKILLRNEEKDIRVWNWFAGGEYRPKNESILWTCLWNLCYKIKVEWKKWWITNFKLS